ncbi:MAG: class I SAM-dependent methyltransferase, partial [bacterium]|nr:class I SAM-dependent methyltransferase [bacterium]
SLIIANNVFAHIDDLKDVMRGIKKLLGDKGIFVFEVHWVGNLIGEGGFDQIYHEHLCYFSLHALLRLMQEQKLEIFDVELIPIHGQSMRVYVGKKMGVSGSVNRFLKTEKNLGLNSAETFLKFAEKTKNNKEKLLNFLLNLRGGGKTIAGYGAPAKGNTLLNYCGIDGKILDFIVDTTPLKQGLYTPGSHIRIWHPDKLKEFQPDYLLLLAWNYADMIIANEAEYRKKGGKFIIPVPEVKVV